MHQIPLPTTAAARGAPGRRRAAALAVAAVVAFVAVVPLTPSAAQEPPPGDGAAPAEPAAEALDALAEARALLPDHLRGVPASSTRLRRAEQEVLSLEATIVTNRTVRDESNLRLVGLAERRATQRDRIAAQRRRRLAAGIRAEELRADLAELAVAPYVGGGRSDAPFPLDASQANDAGRQEILVDAVETTLRGRLAAAEGEVADATVEVEQGRAELASIVEQVHTTTARRDAAVAELARAEPALPAAQEYYRDAFMVAEVVGADFSVVAYDAYRTAARESSCGVRWTVLAGIGRVESRHGTYGGARPQQDGSTAPRIIGIALDGRPGIATIGDSDGGALDGDATFDRAVGPMQFIPGTWRTARRDGNGDGSMDPHNLYDAAAAAAGYLCRTASSLDDGGTLNRAILTYNRSQAYVDAVLGHGRDYARLGLP